MQKKTISPVVGVTLLIVVSVSSVIFFQTWFTSFSSITFTDIERDSISAAGVNSIETIIGDNLYLNLEDNTSILDIQINGVNCGISGEYGDIVEIEIKECVNDTSFTVQEVVVITNEGIITEQIFTGPLTFSPTLIGYNVSIGRYLGGTNPEEVNAIAVSNSDNFAVVGYSDSNNLGTGALQGTHSGFEEGFITLFNSNGTFQWGQWMGSNTADGTTTDVIFDSNGDVYVAGSTRALSGDSLTLNNSVTSTFLGYIIKFNSTGNLLWGYYIGGGGNRDNANKVAIDSSNNVYLGGRASFDNLTGALGIDLNGTDAVGVSRNFFVKFSSNGTPLWGQWLGRDSTGTDISNNFRSIAVDLANNVYALIGNSQSDLTEHNITMQGNYSSTSEDAILKFDSSGNFLWGQWLGSSEMYDIAFDSSNNVYISGSLIDISDDNITYIDTVSYSNLFRPSVVFKFDSSGNSLWTQTFNFSSGILLTSEARSISIDSDDRIYLVGSTNTNFQNIDTSSFFGTFTSSGTNQEGYVIEINAQGEVQTGQWIGGTQSDVMQASAIDSLDNIYVGGYVDTAITDDNLTIPVGTYLGTAIEGFFVRLDGIFN